MYYPQSAIRSHLKKKKQNARNCPRIEFHSLGVAEYSSEAYKATFIFSFLPKNICLVAIAKLRKSAISIVMCVCSSVCLSISMEQLGSHKTDVHEIWYLRTLRKFLILNSS
jgi:hypothetical protein